MRVLICYTARHPLTVAAAPVDTEWVDVSRSPTAYWKAMAERWEPSDDLLVLEHDVLSRPDVLAGFEGCAMPWCLHGYADICHASCMEAWRNHLGCTRFRKEIIAAVPRAVTAVEERLRHWTKLCDGIGQNLRWAGYTHHWHQPSVVHHHMDLKGIAV